PNITSWQYDNNRERQNSDITALHPNSEEGTKNYHIDKAICNSVSISQNNVSESIETFNNSAIPEDRLSIIPSSQFSMPLSNIIENDHTIYIADNQNQIKDKVLNYCVKIQIAKIYRGPGDHCTLPCKIFTVLPNNRYHVICQFGVLKNAFPAGKVVPLGPKEFPELDNLLINKTISIVEAARLQSNSFASDKGCNCVLVEKQMLYVEADAIPKILNVNIRLKKQCKEHEEDPQHKAKSSKKANTLQIITLAPIDMNVHTSYIFRLARNYRMQSRSREPARKAQDKHFSQENFYDP
ncbi:7034_t:CDS:2, partial [Gigaspora margarita]